jgi:hypothetical protein
MMSCGWPTGDRFFIREQSNLASIIAIIGTKTGPGFFCAARFYETIFSRALMVGLHAPRRKPLHAEEEF